MPKSVAIATIKQDSTKHRPTHIKVDPRRKPYNKPSGAGIKLNKVVRVKSESLAMPPPAMYNKPAMRPAGKANEMIDAIRGAHRDRFVADKKGYTNNDVAELQEAVATANENERAMKTEGVGNPDYVEPFQQQYASPYHKRTTYLVKWEDRRNAIMANVTGGIGPIFLAQRGDFNLATNMLKHKNKHNIPRFAYTIAGKHIMPKEQWPSSSKFWLYQYDCPDFDRLVSRIAGHSEMQGWDIKNLGNKPMDFVATDRAIYDHLTRLCEAGKVNPITINPGDFFAMERKVKSVDSWLSAMDTKFDQDEEW